MPNYIAAYFSPRTYLVKVVQVNRSPNHSSTYRVFGDTLILGVRRLFSARTLHKGDVDFCVKEHKKILIFLYLWYYTTTCADLKQTCIHSQWTVSNIDAKSALQASKKRTVAVDLLVN